MDTLLPSNHSAIPSEVNQTTYEFDYYTGSQISIYFGNLLIDDIEHIQYNVTQSKRPVYGYASQYFHSVADGQVIIEGAFTIAFKEANYLIGALQYYKEHQSPIRSSSALKAWEDKKKEIVVDRLNIEEYFRQQKEGSKYQTLPLDLMESVAALSDNAWEGVAEAFEDRLWKNDGPAIDFIEPNIRDTTNINTDKHRRADQFPPIDIWILYGDLTSPAANHTIKRLIDVHIIGEGQVIAPGGENIHESYRFFAKNLA